MLEQFLEYDKWLLLQINGSNSSFWDQFMWIYTGRFIWLPLVLSLCYVYCRKCLLEAILILLVSAIVATLTDQISTSFFKPFFARCSPTQDPELLGLVDVVNNYRGGKYGFVSSHAANAVGMVTFTSLVFRRKIYTMSMVIWALLNCYTRIYLGVHYPGDILGGTILGLTVGIVGYKLYVFVRTGMYYKGWLSDYEIPYVHVNIFPVLITLYATWMGILLYATIA